MQKQFVLKRVAATIQAGATPTCTPDLSAGAVQVISYVSGNLKIDNPTNNVDTAVWFIRLANTSGGAMGTLTWGTTFKQGTVTNPASGKSRIFCFYFDGTNNWKMFETADDL